MVRAVYRNGWEPEEVEGGSWRGQPSFGHRKDLLIIYEIVQFFWFHDTSIMILHTF